MSNKAPRLRDMRHRQRAIVMGEERAPARRLPFERRPERRRIETDRDKIVTPREMEPRGFKNLILRRQMNKAVGAVDRGGNDEPPALRRGKVRLAHDLENHRHGRRLARAGQGGKRGWNAAAENA